MVGSTVPNPLVLHASWSSGNINVWAESSLEAFAEGEVLFTALVEAGLPEAALTGVTSLQLELPKIAGHHVASDRMQDVSGVVLEEGGELDGSICDTPSVGLRADHLGHLAQLEDSKIIRLAHDVRWWLDVGDFAAELMLRHRYVPTLVRRRDRTLTARWSPWLHDPTVRGEAERLLGSMPAVVLADESVAGQSAWDILVEILVELIDSRVRRVLRAEDYVDSIDGQNSEDPSVAWLSGLLDTGTSISSDGDAASTLFRGASEWLGTLSDPEDGAGIRLGLRLLEPPKDADAKSARWTVQFFLQAAGDEGERLEADEIHNDPEAGLRLGMARRAPDELLLAELSRAARACRELEPALEDAKPAELVLDTVCAHRLLTAGVPLLREAGIVVELPEWWNTRDRGIGLRLSLAPSESESGSTSDLDAGASVLGLDALVDFKWEISVGDQILSFDEFQALLAEARRGPVLRRVHDQWVELDPEMLADAAARLAAAREGQGTILEAMRMAWEGEEGGIPLTGIEASGWISELLDSGSSNYTQVEQPESLQGELRPYQQRGLSWLAFLDRFGLGSCLADDMGLGKTVQLLALLLHERKGGAQPGCTLLVVPTSVVSNWKREAQRFAPELRVAIHHGLERASGDTFDRMVESSDIIVTTYSLVGRDKEDLERTQWHRVVLDEAQYIKNPPTKQAATIRSLSATRRIALTGTPVENRLSELWSIMEFLNPGYLGSSGEFRRRFAVPIERHRDNDRAERLRKMVQPFVLRRVKTDRSVIDDLPPCTTTIENATLTPEQATLYEQAVSGMMGELGESEGMRRRGLVLAMLVRLKQICNHPGLVDADANSSELGIDPEAIRNRSGKCRRLCEMLEEGQAAGSKALVFTQFRRMGHLLVSMLRRTLDREVLFLHGGTPTAKRQEMVDRFQEAGNEIPVFVLSLKAGGVGLNLTAANHVFHFDRWWNPAVENQATDRAFRIGQTRAVQVHKFVCSGTLEERIDRMIESKVELARNIVGSGEGWLTELDTDELRSLLAFRGGDFEDDE
ncbi:MAG: ATP-dependent helicase [Phycisphaerae bacterium]|nr:ATP-dependent helicase [Phycisphaerae bacterium]